MEIPTEWLGRAYARTQRVVRETVLRAEPLTYVCPACGEYIKINPTGCLHVAVTGNDLMVVGHVDSADAEAHALTHADTAARS